ncbi:hypothetical protein [Bacteroides sp.]|uniref:hypothetical protein n=1 Tax=Bacteroides sp. TaxID=29523 RepID=UPI0026066F0C|nr:hypothetical protein [Bacteroides sp.]
MKDYNDIEIQYLTTSTNEARYLLYCKDHYYETNYSIVELLQNLQEFKNEEEAISFYINKGHNKYTKEEIQEIISRYIHPLLIKDEKKSKTFIYQKELLSASAIDKFSTFFTFLFYKPCMWATIFLTFSLDIYFLSTASKLLYFNNQVNVYIVLGLLIFIFFSSFWHEMGHASACKHFNISHGGIGIGLYLNFPVLYTDVTRIWKLNAQQRCIVNIAGVYFQSFLLLFCLISFFLTYNFIFKYLILIMNLGILMTLNPFFKFDGYWIASDLMGIPNLRKRSKELLVYCYRFIRKDPTINPPYLMQISKTKKIIFFLYSLLVNLFMGYYFFYIIPIFLYNFIQSFPKELETLIISLSNKTTPPFALLHNIGSQVIFILLISILFISIIRSIKQYIHAKQK